MAITSSWRMIVEVVPDDKNKKDEQRKKKEQRRRRRYKARNLLGLSLGGTTRASTLRGRGAGLPDEEAVATEDDDEDDDDASWRMSTSCRSVILSFEPLPVI